MEVPFVILMFMMVFRATYLVGLSLSPNIYYKLKRILQVVVMPMCCCCNSLLRDLSIIQWAFSFAICHLPLGMSVFLFLCGKPIGNRWNKLLKYPFQLFYCEHCIRISFPINIIRSRQLIISENQGDSVGIESLRARHDVKKLDLTIPFVTDLGIS